MAGVSLKALSKSFGHTAVLEAFDLEIRDGEFLVVVGPSGCGKSTLLRLVAGLEAASSGEIVIGTRTVTSLPPAARGVAMVFQSYALYPHMTAFDNMAFGLTVEKRSRLEVEARIREAARLLRIEDLLDRKPAALSGGQRQRVAIGRAIVRSPQVFLFDEPLSNLDAALRADMRLEMARLHRTLGRTTIYVTHDQSEAMTLGDRIVVLNRGRVEQIGSPLELYRRPATRFVAEFLGNPRINLFEARVVRRAAGGIEIDAAGRCLFIPIGTNELAAGQLVHVGLRPEALVPDMEGDLTIEGEVDAVEALGHATLAHVATALSTFVVSMPGACDVERGRTLRLGLRGTDCHVFDGEGMAVWRK